MGNVGGSVDVSLKDKEPDEATMIVCKQLGVSVEDVKKYGMKED